MKLMADALRDLVDEIRISKATSRKQLAHVDAGRNGDDDEDDD